MDFFVGLLFLSLMEIVLGIDNLVFITILSSKLPKDQQPLARKLGLAAALITRLALLGLLYAMVHGTFFQANIFTLTDIGVPESFVEKMVSSEDLPDNVMEYIDGDAKSHVEEIGKAIHTEHVAEANGISIKDLILFLGGLFLVGKSIYEIHDELGGKEHTVAPSRGMFAGVLIQIAIMDIVFSLDSVITAVGMVDDIWVMVTAIIIAVAVMVIFAEPVGRFVEDHPTLKMLALSFMILIGVMLVAEGVGAHLDKGYIYFAMFFGLIVEVLNIMIRGKNEPEASAA